MRAAPENPAFSLEQIIDANISDVFNYFLKADLSTIVASYLFIPAIQVVHPKKAWTKPGAVRTVFFTNGAMAANTLKMLLPEMTIVHELHGFTGSAKLIIRMLQIRIDFLTVDAHATKVTVHSNFNLTGTLAFMVFNLLLLPLFRNYFKKALAKASLNACASGLL